VAESHKTYIATRAHRFCQTRRAVLSSKPNAVALRQSCPQCAAYQAAGGKGEPRAGSYLPPSVLAGSDASAGTSAAPALTCRFLRFTTAALTPSSTDTGTYCGISTEARESGGPCLGKLPPDDRGRRGRTKGPAVRAALAARQRRAGTCQCRACARARKHCRRRRGQAWRLCEHMSCRSSVL